MTHFLFFFNSSFLTLNAVYGTAANQTGEMFHFFYSSRKQSTHKGSLVTRTIRTLK